MKFVVIGLGSMGKRRVRNLHALGHTEIVGVDVRSDRRLEAQNKLAIQTTDDLDATFHERPDALIISTPPQHHMRCANLAASKGVSCFIEASVVDADKILDLAERTEGTDLVFAPSCTMRYFNGPKEVTRLVRDGVIGTPLVLNYHTGQYLPDWHPWEDIKDYYVSQRETGGCREIVPFELTWLNDAFGDPQPLRCLKEKVTTIAADIDDLYHFTLRYPGGLLANVTVEVISRPVATRELRVLGSTGQLVFSSDEGRVRYVNLETNGEWKTVHLDGGKAEFGYINPEEPYIAEMADFVRAVQARQPAHFPNTLRDDWRVLRLLSELESLA